MAFFNREKQERFCEYLRCEFWMAKLAYLKDIFGKLNIINSSMQGKNENILTATDTLHWLPSKRKLSFGRTKQN
jgi:hypothetical protein